MTQPSIIVWKVYPKIGLKGLDIYIPELVWETAKAVTYFILFKGLFFCANAFYKNIGAYEYYLQRADKFDS